MESGVPEVQDQVRGVTSVNRDPTAATEKQIAFLEGLGVDAPAGVSKQEATELIDQAHNK